MQGTEFMINKKLRCVSAQMFILSLGLSTAAHARSVSTESAPAGSLMPVIVLGVGILLAVVGVAAIIVARGKGPPDPLAELADARTALLNWSLQPANKDAVARLQSEGADEPRESRAAEPQFVEVRQVARRCALAGLPDKARQLLDKLPLPPDSKGWRKVRPNMPGAEVIAWAWFSRGFTWKAIAEATGDQSARGKAIECFTQAEAWFKDHMDPPVLLQKAELLANQPDKFAEMLDDVEEAWRRSQLNVKAPGQGFRAPAGVAYLEVMVQKYSRDPQRGGDIFAVPAPSVSTNMPAKNLSGPALRFRIEETLKSVASLIPSAGLGQFASAVDAGLASRFHATVAEFHQINGKWVDASEACVAATGEQRPEGNSSDALVTPRPLDDALGLRGVNARRAARRVWVESLLQQSNHPSAAWLVIRFGKNGSMTLSERKRLAEIILQQTAGAGDRSLTFETIRELRKAALLDDEGPVTGGGGTPDPLARIRDQILRGSLADAANDLLDLAVRSGSDSTLRGMIGGIASDILRHPAGYGLSLEVKVRLERLQPEVVPPQAAPRPLICFKPIEQAGKVSGVSVRIAGDAFAAGQKLRAQLLNKDNQQIFGKGLLGSMGKLIDRELELRPAPASNRASDGWTDTTTWLELGSGISLDGAADLGSEIRVRISHPFTAVPLDHSPIIVRGTFAQIGPPTPAVGELPRSSFYVSELLACVVAFVARAAESASPPSSAAQGFSSSSMWQETPSLGLGGGLSERLVDALSRRLESEMDARDFAGCLNLKGGRLKSFVDLFQGVPIGVMKDVVSKCQAALSDLVRGALAQIMLDVSEIRERRAGLEADLGVKFPPVKTSEQPRSVEVKGPGPIKPLTGTLLEMIEKFNVEFAGSFAGLAPIDPSRVWETCEPAKKLLLRLGVDLRVSRQLQEAERAQQAYWLACKISDRAPRT